MRRCIGTRGIEIYDIGIWSLSGLIALRPWYIAAVVLGLLWTCGGIAMLMMLPAPTWFAVADVVLYVPAALLGVKLGGALTGSSSPAVAAQ